MLMLIHIESFFITPDGSTKTKNTAVQNEK